MSKWWSVSLIITRYTGKSLHTVLCHPQNSNAIIYGIGSNVVIQHLDDPHHQEFLRGHDEPITALAIARSGQMIASGQSGSTTQKGHEAPVLVWDFDSKMDLYQLFGITGAVTALEFSPDGRFLAAAGADNKFYVWDMQTGEIIVGKGKDKQVSCMKWGALSGEGRSKRPTYSIVLTVGQVVYINTLRYDVKNMSYVMTEDKMQMPASGLVRNYHVAVTCTGVADAAVGEELEYLCMGSSVGDICVFKMGAKVYRASVPVTSNGVLSLCVTPEYVFCGGGDGRVKKLRGADTQWSLEAEVQLNGKVMSMSLSACGSFIICGTSTGHMYQIRVDTVAAEELSEAHTDAVVDVSFGTRSDIFSTIGRDGSVRVWDLSEYNVMTHGSVGSLQAEALCVLFDTSGDGEAQLLTGWSDGFLRAYSAETGNFLWHVADAHGGPVTALAATPMYLASGGNGGSVKLWARDSRKLLLQFSKHSGKKVTQVLPDCDQAHLLHSAGEDRTVFTYDLKKEKQTIMHEGVPAMAFTGLSQRRDSEQELVTAGKDGKILFWDCDVPEAVMKIQDPNRMQLNSIQISPSGRFMVVSGSDHQIKVYDVVQEALVAVGHGHSNTVHCARWSPDEKQIVSVSEDACICVWNFYGVDE